MCKFRVFFLRSVISIAIFTTDVLASSETARVIGKTFPISEESAIGEIARRGRTVDPEEVKKKLIADAMNPHLAAVHAAPTDRTRRVTPEYVAEFDVPDKDGNIIYPAGYKINVLDYVDIPFRIVVILSNQTEWAKGVVKENDVLIVAGDGYQSVRQKMGRKVSVLDEVTKRRLGIEYAPSVISQDGKQLVIQEFDVDLDYVPTK